ncbi:MAG: T9SS type A sorting domain-containing protein, partial [Thermodesulfovibrionia bacterium]|nr:T9SS type A sorting domain-containing protein [Thermodesulfovibrionia bacterium]
QNVIIVEPDAGVEIGALNDAVAAVDTNEFDNTIFELKRDGLYIFNGSISHTGGTLHIRAEDGEGHRPILQPGIDETFESEVLFRPGAGLHLEGVYLYSNDELGNKPNQHIRSSANNSKFVFEDCYFDYSWQSVFRSDGIDNSIFVNNCIVRNTWRSWNPANGYFIDIRGTTEDTIVLTNNTLYNNGRDFIRFDEGLVKYLFWDHNTVFAMNFRGFEADRVPIPYCNWRLDLTFNASVTNNIFYNVAYMQKNNRHDAMFYMDSIVTNPDFLDADRTIDLSNNNWWSDPVWGEILAETEADIIANETYSRHYVIPNSNPLDSIPWFYEGPNTNLFWNQELLDTSTTYSEKPVIWHFIENGQVDTSNIFREELTFENPPPLRTEYFRWYAEHNFDRFIMEELTPPYAHVDEDSLKVGEVTEGAYDFSYNADSRSATAADDGGPLGDPEWELMPAVSVADLSAREASVRTFPNPFTDNVTFEFESRENSSVRIDIYNLLGKEVYSERMPVTQGKNSVIVNLSGISVSGIYLYQIQSELPGGVKSIGYGKFMKH